MPIVWRRHDVPGHEYSRIDRVDASWSLSGVAVFTHDGQPSKLDYSILCDASWQTRSATVSGWVGERRINAVIAAENGSWMLNGSGFPAVGGCIDVDLNFSPSTNLLPIRRLNLAIGERAEVNAAWLRFPGFTLERLDQFYTRVAERTYRYESATGYVATIEVDGDGLPVTYGDIWSADPNQ